MSILEEAYAIWTGQMMLDVVRNLVASGHLDLAGTLENVAEAEMRLTRAHPDHASHLRALAELYRLGLQDAESYLRKD